MAEKLSENDVEQRLAGLQGWSLADGKLSRDFKFADFARAFGFMASAAIEADKLNHHPEWSNVYNKVSVRLVTHEAKGITDLDFQLARKMNELLPGEP
ncbi:MAG TPA: 4a-hydroxytetrahydrobiopterin dehydratase [Woeseiaceae bacterium]|nr:4a-hydroxytetrahydrobiopterin dehydratase [Woeseiaceae bacterium]